MQRPGDLIVAGAGVAVVVVLFGYSPLIALVVALGVGWVLNERERKAERERLAVERAATAADSE